MAQTDIGLYILQAHRKALPLKLENLSYSLLEDLVDCYNTIGEYDLAQIIFDYKRQL